MWGQTESKVEFFYNRHLQNLIESEYLVLRFPFVCEVDMGLGADAPYLYVSRGCETLHLVSSGRVSIPLGRVGIYRSGRLLKSTPAGQLHLGSNKLINEVVPVMEIPTTFVVSMSWVGKSCRGYVNFGPAGIYPILCVLDREQRHFPVSRNIGTNTQCRVSIVRPLGAEHGVPIVAVSVHELI